MKVLPRVDMDVLFTQDKYLSFPPLLSPTTPRLKLKENGWQQYRERSTETIPTRIYWTMASIRRSVESRHQPHNLWCEPNFQTGRPSLVVATRRSVYRIADDSWSTKEDEESTQHKKLAVQNRHQCREAAGGASRNALGEAPIQT